MRESNVLATIMRECCRGAVRLFRNNVAQAWVGQSTRFVRRTTVTVNAGDVLIRAARPLHAGLTKGSADLIGWQAVVITPAMAGRTVAVFTSVEVKSDGGRASDAQLNWQDNVARAGGYAVVARSADDVSAALSNLAGRAPNS